MYNHTENYYIILPHIYIRKCSISSSIYAYRYTRHRVKQNVGNVQMGKKWANVVEIHRE